MFPKDLTNEAANLIDLCRQEGLKIATAESCTGGLIAGLLTEIAGSSAVVERGVVTYSNKAKTSMLAVPAPLIQEHGAVSEPVAEAMVTGCLAGDPPVDVAVAVTGVAGPGGGTADKPVGMVCFAVMLTGAAVHSETLHFDGDRTAVRLATVGHAIRLLREGAMHPPLE